MELSNLPTEVLNKIIEFRLGKPEYIKIKHSQALKRIQNRYRITHYGPKKTRNEIDTIIEFCILREGVPFKVKNIESIVFNQIDELLNLLEDEVGDEDEYNAFLSVEVEVMAREPDKEYEENVYEYCEISSRHFDVDEESMEDCLDMIIQELEEQIEEEQQEHNIIGIQAFHFKLEFWD